MQAWPAVALLVAFAFAGCMSASGSDEPLIQLEDPATGGAAEASPVDAVGQWPLVLREEPRGHIWFDESGYYDFANEPQPRRIEVKFEGLRNEVDEWGRPVPTYVFEMESLDLVFDEMDFDGGEPTVKVHWDSTPLRYFFDAADLRNLGVQDGDTRFYPRSAERLPFANTISGDAFTFLVLKRMGGPAGSLDIPDPDGQFLYRLHLEPGGDRIFDGTCDVHSWAVAYLNADGSPIEFEEDEEGATATLNESSDAGGDADAYLGEEEEEEENWTEEREPGAGSFVCLDGTDVPLWTWTGSSLQSGIGYVRDSPSPPVPQLQGAPLAPVEHPRLPWQTVQRFEGLDATLVPPIDHEGDWASMVASSAAAWPGDPDYLGYHATHDPYVSQWVSGMAQVPRLPVPPSLGQLVTVPVTLPQEDWLVVMEPAGARLEFIRIPQANGGPEPVAYQGFDMDAWAAYDPSELPDLAAIGAVRASYGELDLVPGDDAAMLEFWLYGDLSEYGIERTHVGAWWAMDSCLGPEGGRFASIEAGSGQLLVTGRATYVDGQCAVAESGVAMPGAGHLWGKAATLASLAPQQPSVAAMPAPGPAAGPAAAGPAGPAPLPLQPALRLLG